jgi:hypothetical protein
MSGYGSESEDEGGFNPQPEVSEDEEQAAAPVRQPENVDDDQDEGEGSMNGDLSDDEEEASEDEDDVVVRSTTLHHDLVTDPKQSRPRKKVRRHRNVFIDAEAEYANRPSYAYCSNTFANSISLLGSTKTTMKRTKTTTKPSRRFTQMISWSPQARTSTTTITGSWIFSGRCNRTKMLKSSRRNMMRNIGVVRLRVPEERALAPCPTRSQRLKIHLFGV